MWFYPFQEAYDHVLKCCSTIRPNRGFIEQLSQWEEAILGAKKTNIEDPNFWNQTTHLYFILNVMFQHSEVFQKGIVHRTNCPFTDVFVIISTIFGLFIILCMAIHLFYFFFKVCVKKVEYPIMELCVHWYIPYKHWIPHFYWLMEYVLYM